MNPKVIERLLIDRGMGELSKDVSALLQAHLDAHPRDAQRADAIDDTIHLAQAALRTTPTDRPATPFADVQRLHWRRATLRSWTRRLATAATIALAFWLGTHATPPSRHPGPVAINRRQPPPRTGSDGSTGFWSTARLRESITAHRSTPRPRIPWPGPLTRPQIGGAS